MSGAALYVVRGGGLAGWAAAALLVDSLPRDTRIVVTDSDPAPAPSSLDIVALAPDATLLTLSGMPADRLMAEDGADILLGTVFEDWRDGRTVVYAPQEPLPAIDGIAIHDLVLRAAMGLGHSFDYADFHSPLCFQARAAGMARYAPPSDDRASPRSLLRPGLSIDGRALAARLRARALAAGVAEERDHVGDAILTIDTRPAPPDAAWVSLPDGADHILSLRLADDLRRPAMRVVHLAGGVLTVAGHLATFACHADAFDEAEAIVLRALPGVAVTHRSVERHHPGLDAQPWRGDTLRLGRPAAQLGAVMGIDSVLLDTQLRLLAGLLPADRDQLAACRRAYTARWLAEARHHADFVQLVLMHRDHAPPPAPIRPELARRLDQFRSRNRAVAIDGDPYEPQAWLDMMIALGLVPRRYDPQADRIPPAAAQVHLGRMVQAFDRTLAAMPPYPR